MIEQENENEEDEDEDLEGLLRMGYALADVQDLDSMFQQLLLLGLSIEQVRELESAGWDLTWAWKFVDGPARVPEALTLASLTDDLGWASEFVWDGGSIADVMRLAQAGVNLEVFVPDWSRPCSVDEAVYLAEAGYDLGHLELILGCDMNKKTRKQVFEAWAPGASPTELSALAKSRSKYVRAALALRTDPNWAAELAHDKDSFVREACASREDCTIEQLQQFARDSDEEVRSAAFHNPNATEEIKALWNQER